MQTQKTINEFRKLVFPALIEKGVTPPRPGSKEEQGLYNEWTKGLEILIQNTHGSGSTNSN